MTHEQLINSTAMTLDAVIDVSDWFVAEDDHDGASRTLLASCSSMLLGRKTYEGLAGYWPSASGPWAEIINPMPKYVASRSELGTLEWNARPIEGDAFEGVRRLKAERDGDIFMSGCGELARELIQAGLVDELLFWIPPRIQGAGNRPYEAATVPVRLLEAKSFDSGVTRLRYQPIST
ncbi:MAG: dihydrofolate reductase [Chloroflexi bacterium]|nr:dihydrofolate reductase [Chloroflexota bacterium]